MVEVGSRVHGIEFRVSYGTPASILRRHCRCMAICESGSSLTDADRKNVLTRYATSHFHRNGSVEVVDIDATHVHSWSS